MDISQLQIGSQGRLRHFLSIEGLNRQILMDILKRADSFLAPTGHVIQSADLLAGRTVMNLFFETSTRTRTTFELAEKRLSANVINLNIAASATKKGESLLDTIRNLQAMQCDLFVVRHGMSGAAQFIAQHVESHVAVINGGDGWHAHPSQAMLDMYTIRHHKKDFESLRVAIVGDVMHSRVARSQIQALGMLGAHEVRVIAPKTLIPADIEKMGVNVFHKMSEGLKDVDVVIMLRLQSERMRGAFIPSQDEFYHTYGLTTERLARAKPDAIVMHPGPINRGVEIESAVADGPQSVILQQVNLGIAVRMAILAMTMRSDDEVTQ